MFQARPPLRHGVLYVTAYASHALYAVARDGSAKRLLGTGERGIGDATQAQLSFPNGIACHPWLPRLYINEYANTDSEALLRRSIVREIDLAPTVAPP